MNASSKQLKVFLVPKIRKLGLAFLVLKLGEFPHFDNFLDLANFWILDNFLVFENFSLFGSTDF